MADRADRAIVVGGTGIGQQMTCTIRGIRAGLCPDVLVAEIARTHNDANVLVLGAKIVTPPMADRSSTCGPRRFFEGGRHQRRLDQLAALEEDEMP